MTVVKAQGARDFLGLVPTLIGYTPTESVVLIPFAGPRTIGAMRFDLPEPATLDHREIATTMVGMVCKLDAADGVAMIAYSRTQDHDTIEPLMMQAIARARDCGLRLVDVLYVASDGWGSFVEGAAPRPLEEVAATEVAGVKTAAGNQLSGAALPELSERFVTAVNDAIGTFDPEYMDDPVVLFEALLTEPISHLTGEMVAFLNWALSRPAIRDIFLVQTARDQAAGDEALSAQLAWEEGVEYPAALAMSMWGEGPRPDPERLQAALDLARTVAAVTGTAGSFATCGWLAWALGRSTEADHYASRGLAVDPEHGLCGIVQSFVRAGHLPNWAFLPRT